MEGRKEGREGGEEKKEKKWKEEGEGYRRGRNKREWEGRRGE